MNRHRIHRVGRHRSPGRGIDHLLRIAVIGRDDREAAPTQRRTDYRLDRSIDHPAGSDRRLELPGVADHVGVGVIENHHLLRVRLQAPQQLRGDRVRAHLRPQIVGRHPGGGHEAPLLADVDAARAPKVRGDRFAELGRARRRAVMRHPGGQAFDGGVDDVPRSLEVRLADLQVNHRRACSFQFLRPGQHAEGGFRAEPPVRCREAHER